MSSARRAESSQINDRVEQGQCPGATGSTRQGPTHSSCQTAPGGASGRSAASACRTRWRLLRPCWATCGRRGRRWVERGRLALLAGEIIANGPEAHEPACGFSLFSRGLEFRRACAQSFRPLVRLRAPAAGCCCSPLSSASPTPRPPTSPLPFPFVSRKYGWHGPSRRSRWCAHAQVPKRAVLAADR